MSKALDLLRRIVEGDNRGDFFISLELLKEIEAILTLPEHIKEREVSGKIISTDDVCNWNLTVAALKDYDHVYVNGIRYTEYQPDINTQYLLDQVARLTAENAMLKEKWLAPPKHTSLELEVADCCGSEDYREGFKDGALYAEKAHGITGA